jgi:hypothetical protein
VNLDYIKQIETLDEAELQAEIVKYRHEVMEVDRRLTHCRETNTSPSDEWLAAAKCSRDGLRLAERELSKRGQVPWGVCDNGMDEQENDQ